ncbi:MAG: hypothetical protein A2977_02200 [Alphaproteobacteria bacterium RIFCSPLOWO2_01_FULL_45_8]|nr:MAG: hypothetical protein A3K20_01410 [Alphaproteobacteria bacterium GWA1_45_9]OFW89888.1 MAG: hypothetical protein A2621_03295 [Alphaproteobacteria bacterium RIFCSPHIGHO2_01_FULL_41_14]OFW96470.1 MAG: hypothetical protein A2977_02200 [Alphaproteobacteria bacterium RIFCSPLOWO2_01_FULL_45_8]
MKSLIYGAVFFVLSGWGAGADLGPDIVSAPSSSSLKSRSPYVMKVEADPLALARVLCLDGGGLRGVYAAEILSSLETELKEGKRICDFFQGGITGTSTGSLIALALVAPNHFNKRTKKMEPGPYSASDIVSFYEEMADEVFKCWTPSHCWTNATHGYDEGCLSSLKKTLWSIMTCFGCCACCKNCDGFCGPKYGNHALKILLERYFGGLTLKEALVPVQIVSYDVLLNQPVYFDSYRHTNIRFVDAALCSSAAPTYLPGVSIGDGNGSPLYQCIDGGIFDNSACLAALRFGLFHTQKTLQDSGFSLHLTDFVLLSIGTGQRIIGSRYKKLKHASKLTWASEAIEISINGTSQATHANLSAIYEAAELEEEPRQYFRIQPILPDTETQMDDSSIIPHLRARARADTTGDYCNAAFKEFVKEHARPRKPNESTKKDIVSFSVV